MILVTLSSSTCIIQRCQLVSLPRRSSEAYLHILQAILLTYAPQHILLAALLHFPGDQKLVKYEVCLLEIEDDVELADIAVVFVHLLDVPVNDFQCDQLIIGRVASGDEEK